MPTATNPPPSAFVARVAPTLNLASHLSHLQWHRRLRNLLYRPNHRRSHPSQCGQPIRDWHQLHRLLLHWNLELLAE